MEMTQHREKRSRSTIPLEVRIKVNQTSVANAKVSPSRLWARVKLCEIFAMAKLHRKACTLNSSFREVWPNNVRMGLGSEESQLELDGEGLRWATVFFAIQLMLGLGTLLWAQDRFEHVGKIHRFIIPLYVEWMAMNSTKLRLHLFDFSVKVNKEKLIESEKTIPL